ncbi:PIN domain-containing protein [Kribbella capetownensis]|uniref:PIN domain-containing protein n=1 Tax=Kribbella capetownensis TaxID=1572659 RepID=UPI00192D3722|nr:PIN domain-containing protein [Kribbella capetownensis]
MNKASRDVLVRGYDPLIEIVDLPDADDRHVLAAAIKAHAQLIVTDNTKDFPRPALRPGTSRRRALTTSYSTSST